MRNAIFMNPIESNVHQVVKHSAKSSEVKESNMSTNFFDDKTILITGGTGSFGKQFINYFTATYPKIKKIIVYSRDELKQSEMKIDYSAELQEKLRFFIGDVRDRQRLLQACEDVDIIIHAAAMKQVDTAEYNPTECVATNISGAENVIHAALSSGVSDVVALSTDKACSPVNLYGATKLASDKLFSAANNIRGRRNIRFSVVRYGNVMGSRGSVIPLFLRLKGSGEVPITHDQMTRFNISLQDGVNMVEYALNNHLGGEIFVPKIPSYKITTLAEAVCPGAKHKIIGMRPGEKLHEEMISHTDSLSTIDLGKYYAILPNNSLNFKMDDFMNHHGVKDLIKPFSYNSGENTEWETVESLRKAITEHVIGLG